MQGLSPRLPNRKLLKSLENMLWLGRGFRTSAPELQQRCGAWDSGNGHQLCDVLALIILIYSDHLQLNREASERRLSVLKPQVVVCNVTW